MRPDPFEIEGLGWAESWWSKRGGGVVRTQGKFHKLNHSIITGFRGASLENVCSADTGQLLYQSKFKWEDFYWKTWLLAVCSDRRHGLF